MQKSGSVEHEITVVWVPRRTLVSNKILEDQGVLGDVDVHELQLFFLPLEQDLLSLELGDSFHDLYLDQNKAPIYQASRALMLIQQRHGLFPRILGKGENAMRLAKLLQRARRELDADEAETPSMNMPSTSIESLVVIDRDVDFATVLLTQLTYEGMIEEYVGIKHNKAEVDSAILGAAGQSRQSQASTSAAVATPPAKQALKRTIALDSSDSLYTQLRGTSFALVGPILNKVAKRLESDFDVRHKAQEISELRSFVNQLPGLQQEHQSLAIHTNLADDLSKQTRTDVFRTMLEVQQNVAAGTDPIYQHETISDLISRNAPVAMVLRLLCLESTLSGGMRPKDLENFKRQILQAYGYQHLLTLSRLERAELLQPRSSASALLLPVGGGSSSTSSSTAGTKTNYAYLRKELSMIIDDYNDQDPDDVAYVYSGYAPLSIRLVQCVLQKSYMQTLHKAPLPLTPSSTGWVGFEDILKSAKGPTFTIQQKPVDEKAYKAKANLVSGTGGPKYVFVMFLGGITFAEIAALRFINSRLSTGNVATGGQSQRRKIVICTTGIISGRSIMEDMVEKATLGNGLVRAVSSGK